MINELRKIGLSELEAKCYLVLHQEPRISGYEVAKRVSVSRTNVYAALRSLTDKGICRMIESDPVMYDAVPIDQLVKLLQSEFEHTSHLLLEQLSLPPQSPPSFYSWKGGSAIESAIRRLAANATKSIVVDVWAEDIHWVENALIKAEQRGVAVTLISIGAVNSSLKNVLVHKRNDEWINVESRKFSMLCDNSAALLGSFGQQFAPSLLETNHPSLTELLQNAFYHDIVMERIELDFNRELSQKYGEDYEQILRIYKSYF
ncbi:TrmB family transcriptional regulator [Paenibacillus alvei]|uniref:TrmB family transcriptional regulator n=1 Tax=Paenibacillus alvei TaxID=44250 RepID=UPI0018CD40DC|nr:TrmB family transcriptional regulator [Paenibacillus alvei]MBG9733477.1 TrmB family transcriptional regulator [Paenibacillus alvei]MBG9742668.1 TrmB family transcriptional regulator [Paenibacillus alvei]MCY9581515.1 TrmB family transcriptional regulator [Paenibacillus alvei]MCY9585478.1 TrmB family transcriptional regulator [Paenibacillus alvei]